VLIIDGSFGEGGGQILRTSLALSLVTGKPFRIQNIRSGRKKPGLMHQHLTAVNAAISIGKAAASGNAIGSQELEFAPATIDAGQYRFAVGTAGSATLVLQTVLPALLITDRASHLTLEGGTHNNEPPSPKIPRFRSLCVSISWGWQVGNQKKTALFGQYQQDEKKENPEFIRENFIG
jgi:RNA 3'-terminal phosphate cyclase (ATP)